MTAVTDGHLLDGRVRYAQPAAGFRSGIEPVLLAASIAARPGQRVLEGGTGAGAALLCLFARVPGLSGVGIEVDPDQAALARANATANGFLSGAPAGAGGMTVLAGHLETVVPDGPFDHAFANPPYHPASGTPPPDQARARAKMADADLLVSWSRALAQALRPRGTLTLILPVARLSDCMGAMATASCPAETVFPLWPKAGVAAKLAIVRGIKGGRGPLRLLPGLILHAASGRFTPETDAVLRGGAALDLGH